MLAETLTARSVPTNQMVIDDRLQRTQRCRCPSEAMFDWNLTDTLAAALRGEVAESLGWDSRFTLQPLAQTTWGELPP